MQRASRGRAPGKLSEAVHQRLNLYALGASAAGIGLLGSAQPSEAKVVYTPTYHRLSNGTLSIPIDATQDFNLTNKFYIITGSWSTQLLNLSITGSAAAVVNGKSAAALSSGVTIGPSAEFKKGKLLMAGAFRETQISSTNVFGPFANTTKHFLGLKFVISGEIHYGWARFSHVRASAKLGPQVVAILTGYAYETVANRPIKAGQMTGGDDEVSEVRPGFPEGLIPQPATLGLLAVGSPALSVWRREDDINI